MQRRSVIPLAALIVLLFAVSSVAAEGNCDSTNCVEVAAAVPAYGLSAAEIDAYVEPEFKTPFFDHNRIHDRSYHQVSGALDIYDAPNGSVIRTLDAGFNFVTVAAWQDGWIQINDGEWVQANVLTDVYNIVSHFKGVLLPETMPQYQIGWMLKNVYPSSEPGGNPLEANGLIFRYTRVNIFASVEIDGWNWYQVGPDNWVHQTSLGKVIPIARPVEVETDRWVAVDLYEQVLVAYEGEQPVFATLISSGLPRWPTREGTFNIYLRRTREDMSWGTPGDDFYYLEEVPWTMFFDQGRALHGTYWHDGLGYRRSHGCVNMSITDAHWLYTWVAQDFETMYSKVIEEGPVVHVFSSGVYE